MKERIIVITGASGGLAEEIIKRLPQTDQLVLLGRDKEKLESRIVAMSFCEPRSWSCQLSS